MRSRLRRLWAQRNDGIRLTKGRAVLLGLCVSIPFSVAIIVGSLGYVKAIDEAEDRIAADRRSQADIERIVVRVVRVEGVRDLAESLERACRRFPTCATELDRAQRQERAVAEREQRRRRRDHGPDRAPEQRADRPPRQPPMPTPQPEPVDGGPPPPPGTSTPSTPPSSPSAHEPVVEVDIPPVDLDGPDGLLPQLLPDVNLPPVDIPPIRVP